MLADFAENSPIVEIQTKVSIDDAVLYKFSVQKFNAYGFQSM